ncbi:hypothetical protein MTR_0004s0450 [Medicago truncatula]|uniref:Uncharacterized protein n=1 Tax=Medicago truncatula TaxID=3880 RepID=A0A072TVS8_MEDTR|nr:hypothetical protein MTR_0004s0450 [Medicago truncatula]
MYYALETLHEGTDEVNQSKINTLLQQGVKESQDLNTLGITTFFGKLKNHEHKILRPKANEEDVKKKKKKSITLKASTSMATSASR